jgi:acyl-CoA thioester hydrolase
VCQVRFSDVDIYRHVNNVKYFEYYQEARIAFLDSLMDDGGSRRGRVAAQIRVDYTRPMLHRRAPYAVETWVSRVGRSSFGLSAEIKDGDTVLSRAEVAMVAFDPATERSRPLDEREKAWLQAVLE